MNKSFDNKIGLPKASERSSSIPRLKQWNSDIPNKFLLSSPKYSNTSIGLSSINCVTTPTSHLDSLIMQTERECTEIKKAIYDKGLEEKAKNNFRKEIEKELTRLDGKFSVEKNEGKQESPSVLEFINEVMSENRLLKENFMKILSNIDMKGSGLAVIQELEIMLKGQNLLFLRVFEQIEKAASNLRSYGNILKERENMIQSQENDLAIMQKVVESEKKRITEEKMWITNEKIKIDNEYHFIQDEKTKMMQDMERIYQKINIESVDHLNSAGTTFSSSKEPKSEKDKSNSENSIKDHDDIQKPQKDLNSQEGSKYKYLENQAYEIKDKSSHLRSKRLNLEIGIKDTDRTEELNDDSHKFLKISPKLILKENNSENSKEKSLLEDYYLNTHRNRENGWQLSNNCETNTSDIESLCDTLSKNEPLFSQFTHEIYQKSPEPKKYEENVLIEDFSKPFNLNPLKSASQTPSQPKAVSKRDTKCFENLKKTIMLKQQRSNSTSASIKSVYK
ncbi:unnamed protein product [Blepharisma stoltei]|uniref:Uncharacterized protein n=1 Tax=Blepharisma stoltei TaxID=1481888 RepID=A0AAU9JQS8_9CILI|nr:unnamed protein product [Blepharisma stoltei]